MVGKYKFLYNRANIQRIQNCSKARWVSLFLVTVLHIQVFRRQSTGKELYVAIETGIERHKWGRFFIFLKSPLVCTWMCAIYWASSWTVFIIGKLSQHRQRIDVTVKKKTKIETVYFKQLNQSSRSYWPPTEKRRKGVCATTVMCSSFAWLQCNVYNDIFKTPHRVGYPVHHQGLGLFIKTTFK